MRHALVAADLGRGDRGGRNAGHGKKSEGNSGRGQPHTLPLIYCARHGEGQGHNTSDCIVIRRELDRHKGDFHPYSDRFPGGHCHERNRHHPSGGRGRCRGGGLRQLKPPNSPQNLPPDLPPDLPRGQFHNGSRHDFSASYPYGTGNMGYSGWGVETGQWSPPPPEDAYAYEYGVAACERSFGVGQYGDVAGRYGYCHHHDDRHYFRQQRETTGKNIIVVFPRLGPTHFSRG